MKKLVAWSIACCCLFLAAPSNADDGYKLWLNYRTVANAQKLRAYQNQLNAWTIDSSSPTAQVAGNELRIALPVLLGKPVTETRSISSGHLVVLTLKSPLAAAYDLSARLKNIPSEEGFVIFTTNQKNHPATVIAGRGETGMLYGVFHFLRLLQTEQDIATLAIESSPRTRVRILNHWDNLDRTVERGYAGFSLWNWHKLPGYIDPRYYDYARANASLGINAAVLTNVNANALILTPAYLEKVAALADLFRPYGIRVYLTARFSAPIEIGGLKTADPLDPDVRQWWKTKAEEIYRYVPDFGGFTVKANSEGQPGPQNYQRTHADGANMLADALAPFHGIVMWRAFVYDNNVPVDRTMQAYNEFKPLDGKFNANVLVQVKNGPLDFQPREPFHPLFGAMPHTPLMVEFQITQEYLGFSTHLVYLATLFKECLDADTYAKGNGSPVSRVIDGTLEDHTLSGMAGVANIGDDRNWCGHPFAQANWYAFGRLAWDHTLTPQAIAGEWIRMTFGNDAQVIATASDMMMASREIAVRYMTPLGLHHIMGWSHHYGPAPWIKDKPRADWTSVYYHRADEQGVGFDRSSTGSNALQQYAPQVRAKYENAETCPEENLLWFHHVAWDRKMRSGKTLWEELCDQYDQGADSVKWMERQWASLQKKIDPEQFEAVKQLLHIQQQEAHWWRDACTSYFQTFSKQLFPAGFARPEKTLTYYESLEFPFAPGIRPKW